MRPSELAKSDLRILEVLVIIFALAVIVAMLLPALRPARAGSRWSCYNKLHQIGLAFDAWSLDSQNRYPMQVPEAEGGARNAALAANVPFVFEVMSNELNTPKVLVCPADAARQFRTSFATNLDNTNISYFIGVDASKDSPAMILGGDRNLTLKGIQLRPGKLHTLRTNVPAGWTTNLHNLSGNVLLVDGSAQQFNAPILTAYLRTNSVDTNRIAVP